MNIRLSNWASVAEIVSGVAVVVTLVILILGIRENTEVTRASVYADLIDSVNDWERDIFRDPELSRLLTAWANERFTNSEMEPLSPSEVDRLQQMIDVLFRNYEKAFFFERAEVIDDAEWSRFERLICVNDARAQAFGIDYREVLNEDFLEYIATSCVD